MGYAPDWNKGSMKKSGATPVKHGVVSRELFHNSNSVQRLADGGGVMGDMSGADMKYEPMPKTDELNIRGEKVGRYEGTDPIVKYRMNMTDDVGGKSLRYQDNPDAKPMPEKRPYDSIDAIIDDKSSSGKKDKNLAGDVVKAVKEANKPKATAASPKSKNQVPALKPEDPNFWRGGTNQFDMTFKNGTGIIRRDVAAGDGRQSEADSLAEDMKNRMEDTSYARKPSTLNASKYRQEKAPEPMHNEAKGSYEQLRAPKKENTYKGTNRRKSSEDSLPINLSEQSPALAKRLNMYYGKK